MAERDLLLGALIKEVLGPRAGAFELLSENEDPLDEYVTGVLAPRSLVPAEDEPLLEAEITGEDDLAADDLAGDAGPDVSPSDDLGPSLDPRMRPSSMGISFALRAQDVPDFDLVATWGRYSTEGGKTGWQRKPFGQVWKAVPAKDSTLEITADDGVRISIRAFPDRRNNQVLRVSVYLVNDTVTDDERGARVHVFQPQLRIRCGVGTELVSLDRAASASNVEDRRLAVLYRQRATLARGHLCSATWGDLDPESPTPISTPDASEAPFHYWIDGLALWGETDASIVQAFSPAQVRTEYVPVVSVTAPDKSWRNEFGQPPELDPEVLADLFDATKMRAALQPMVDGLRAWLASERSVADELDKDEQEVIQSQLDLTAAAADRIQKGVDLVCDNDDARRAFCFANKAIALQSRWAKRDQPSPAANSWYPFQLAFQLLALPGLVDSEDPDREICDLLWFPTGGGKTEAYLGLTAFVLGLRRIRAAREGKGTGCGTAVLSRYTLRLLTIQQFRRAVALVTACEFLRSADPTQLGGWRPKGDADRTPDLWGRSRFSIGLWVGGSVTPSNLDDFSYKDAADKLQKVRGAFSLLRGARGQGEPAQVLRCPCCDAPLAFVGEGPSSGSAETIHLVFGDAPPQLPPNQATAFTSESFVVENATLLPLPNRGYQVLSLKFRAVSNTTPEELDGWIKDHVRVALGMSSFLASARGSRPGYFIRYQKINGKEKDYEFEVFCANPECELASGIRWQETLPAGDWLPPEPFRNPDDTGDRCPIPIWTVDEQIYHRVPSMVVATVDKFARLAYEPRAAAIFGNVTHQHPVSGWFRSGCPPTTGRGLPKNPTTDFGPDTVTTDPLPPPELVIQDELHLIEGPLGSMVGLYETAIDQLASTRSGGLVTRPKYVASTATVREAGNQVASLFRRGLAVFPSPGTTIDDSFFAKTDRAHSLDAAGAGRLYVGLCAPGRGAQTPLVRSWSRLLQHVSERHGIASDDELDGFWTLVGYFNAIRELAGTRTLCRQDIPQRLTVNAVPRELDTEELELSSRTSSEELPGKLDELGRGLPEQPIDIVLTTSMFGTGVDVPRLGLMFVAGQPKTTSSYIQATGRVGRTRGALVVTFLRASRPRDLNHYEYFVGYHDAVYRHVEPITVNPFAERARDHGLGPVAVALLRNARELGTEAGSYTVDLPWRIQERIAGGWHSEAKLMADNRSSSEVNILSQIFETRAQSQPGLRRPAAGEVSQHLAAELDRWYQLAKLHGNLLYFEPTMVSPASVPVVLGDLAHTAANLEVAYENAPNSLREVESTTTFQGRG